MIIQRVAAAEGYAWIRRAYQHYKQKALLWTLITLGIAILPALLGKLLPMLGFLFGDYLQTLLGLGVYRLYKHTKSNRDFDLKLLFQDLSDSKICLSILWLKGLTYLSFLLAVGLIVLLDWSLGVSSEDWVGLIQLVNNKMLYLIPDSLWIILAINFGILLIWLLIVGAAATYAPPLIVFYQKGLFSALKFSLIANIKNVGAFSVFFLVALVFLFGSLLTLGIGYFVLLPVLSLSLIVAFEAIFESTSENQLTKS